MIRARWWLWRSEVGLMPLRQEHVDQAAGDIQPQRKVVVGTMTFQLSPLFFDREKPNWTV
jgi:hypothetical protein